MRYFSRRPTLPSFFQTQRMGFEHGSLRPKATELTTRPPPRPRGQSRHRLTSSWVKICGSSLISLSAIINDLQLGVPFKRIEGTISKPFMSSMVPVIKRKPILTIETVKAGKKNVGKKAGNELEENQLEWNWKLLHTYCFITIKFVFPEEPDYERKKNKKVSLFWFHFFAVLVTWFVRN